MRAAIVTAAVALAVAGCGAGAKGFHHAAPAIHEPACDQQLRHLLALAKKHPGAVSPRAKRILSLLTHEGAPSSTSCASDVEVLKGG